MLMVIHVAHAVFHMWLWIIYVPGKHADVAKSVYKIYNSVTAGLTAEKPGPNELEKKALIRRGSILHESSEMRVEANPAALPIDRDDVVVNLDHNATACPESPMSPASCKMLLAQRKQKQHLLDFFLRAEVVHLMADGIKKAVTNSFMLPLL